MTLAAVAFLALVSQDHVSLKASPHDAAPKPATLWQGDLLEVRGERLGYLQVYDPRRERPGYVRPSQVKVFSLDPASAASLKAVVDFLKDTPGAESLGIAYVAAYLKVAPAAEVGAEVFDALGGFAERLGRRASVRSAAPADELAGHLDVAAGYGVHFKSFEHGDRTLFCYDGEAFRRLLALGGTPEQNGRAALALTRPDCVDSDPGPLELTALETWQADVLARVQPAEVSGALGNKLRIRSAAVLSSLAFHLARAGKDSGTAAARALAAVAGVQRAELADEDQGPYAEAAARVGASRWAAELPRPDSEAPGWKLSTRSGEPGQTCLALTADGAKAPDFQRCTYGQVWMASARFTPAGNAVAVAVQPLASWTELWVLRRGKDGWVLDALLPAPVEPEVGYVEAAGWSPDGKRLLVVREARVEGQVRTRFEVLDTQTLRVQKSASGADALSAFHRWAAPAWRGGTVALR